ncbi:hypothetical protein VPH35_015751 [Triticum aestivum]
MSLRRLLGLSAAVSGRLSRSLSTSTAASSRPPWILVDQVAAATGSAAPGASVRIVEPPCLSDLTVPAFLVDTSAGPDSDSDVMQLLSGSVCSASAAASSSSPSTTSAPRVPSSPSRAPIIHTRFLCNPLTGQLTRLPAINTGAKKLLCGPHMGVLIQAGRGHRIAVAELQGNKMLRFLSDTGKWDIAVTAPRQLPLARRFYSDSGMYDQEAFAFGGRLWWADLSWGAISAGPFSDRPEPRFVELSRGSVMPERPEPAHGWLDVEGAEAVSKRELGRYRRMGVSEGRVRYAEVWQREPFVLSSFALDDEGGGWTLEHRVVLSRLLAEGDYPWLPSLEKTAPQIGALDPLNGNVMYLMVGRHSMSVDMSKEEVIGSTLQSAQRRQLVHTMRKDNTGSKTLADVLVRSDRHRTK